METLIRALVLKYPHWQTLLNNKSICNSTIIEFTCYTCIYIQCICTNVFLNLPLPVNDSPEKVTDSLLSSFLLSSRCSTLHQSSFTQFFSFYLFWRLCCQAQLHFPLVSTPAAADCTQDGDPEIILCNIWLQMWGCNLQIPSPKKAGQWLPCLAFMGGESGGMGKIMRGFRHACSVTVSARQRKAGLRHVWVCTKNTEISVSAPLPKIFASDVSFGLCFIFPSCYSVTAGRVAMATAILKRAKLFPNSGLKESRRQKQVSLHSLLGSDVNHWQSLVLIKLFNYRGTLFMNEIEMLLHALYWRRQR